MIVRRVKVTLSFEVDLDGVPGWGNDWNDWANLAMREVMRQSHYSPVEISRSVETTPAYRLRCHACDQFTPYMRGEQPICLTCAAMTSPVDQMGGVVLISAEVYRKALGI